MTLDEIVAGITPEIGSGLHYGGDALDVWHSEHKPEQGVVIVHEATYVDEDGQDWEMSFRIRIEDVEFWPKHEPDDDLDDWEVYVEDGEE